MLGSVISSPLACYFTHQEAGAVLLQERPGAVGLEAVPLEELQDSVYLVQGFSKCSTYMWGKFADVGTRTEDMMCERCGYKEASLML